jgi:predicted dehydrogenase
MSLIIPAKSHPEVIIQAVAARDLSKAEAFAKSHGIPEVKGSYQGWFRFRYGIIHQLLTKFRHH